MTERRSAEEMGMSPTAAECAKKLARFSPVRSALNQLRLTSWIDTDSVDALVKAVRNPSGSSWRERTVAAWCLGACSIPHMSRQEVNSDLRALAVGAGYGDAIGKLGRGVWRSCLVSVGTATVFAAIAWILNFSGSNDPMPVAPWLLLGWIYGSIVLSFVLLLPVLAVSIGIDAANLRCSMAEAVRSLGKAKDPLAVGLVARALDRFDHTLSSAAREAFPLIAETITEEDYGRLQPQTLFALCSALKHSTPDMALLILKVLARAGDGRCAAPLSRLLDDREMRRVWGLGPRTTEDLVPFAEHVLQILQDRLQVETAAERLLRPAQAPGVPSELLLRPAGSATGVPDEQLLRPAEPRDNPDGA